MVLQMGVAEGWIYVLAESPEGTPFRAYDPIAAKWLILPPTPGRSEGQQWQGFACVALGHKFLLIGGIRSEKSFLVDKYSSGAFPFSIRLSFIYFFLFNLLLKTLFSTNEMRFRSISTARV